MSSSNDCPTSFSIQGMAGVLLCKRPTDVEYNIQKHQDRLHDAYDNRDLNRSNDFLYYPKTRKPVGSNIVIHEKERVLKRMDKSKCALNKHRKWLISLQKMKKEHQASLDQESQDKINQLRSFMAHEEEKRRLYLGLDEAANELDEVIIVNSKKNKKELRLPAWALTESEFEHQQAEIDAAEERHLLDFVDNLGDLDLFEADMEIDVLLDDVQSQVSRLVKMQSNDERCINLLEERESAEKISNAYNSQGEMFGDLNTAGALIDNFLDRGVEDIQSLADTVQRKCKSLWDVHSHHSVRKMVEKEMENLACVKQADMDTVEEEEEKQPPILVKHKDDDGARLAELKSLRKLPFINRNPAI